MPQPFHFYGGVSFSGAREPLANTWTVIGREEDGRLQVVSARPHAFRADLCSFVGTGWRAAAAAAPEERALWGVDFPCGLPAAAGEHLCGADARWVDIARWIADRPPEEVRGAVPQELQTGRATEVGGPGPLDSRSYKQTVEGVRWLHQLREEADVALHPQAAEGGAEGAVIEVAPALSVRELGLPRRRAPGRPGEVRARAAALRTFAGFDDPEHEAVVVTLENAWDAAIACITAWLARDDLHQPFRASDHPRQLLEREGWVYRPPAAVE